MNSWDYYSETIDRIVWSEGTGRSPVRERVEGLLRTEEGLGKIESLTIDGITDLSEEYLSPRTIVVRPEQRGDLGRCPGTHGHLCCNYITLNVYLGCTLGCTYCIMQSYLRNRTLEVHLPSTGTVSAIRRVAEEHPDRTVRIGTGEVGDSLLYDPLFGISGDLVEALADIGNLRFEVKTKTDFVDHLPGDPTPGGNRDATAGRDGAGGPSDTGPLPKGGRGNTAPLPKGAPRNTVVSFSLNPPEVVATEEGVAASLDERLAAAERAIARGYRVAFHFDPMIHIPDWEGAYRSVVDRLAVFRGVTPEWISLGTLRYPPSLKPMIEERAYALDEFVRSGDGKMRYLQPIRAEMYRTVKAQLRVVLPETPVYLCMESPVIWRDMQRAAPGDERSLRAIMQPVVIGGERAGGMR